LRGHCGPERESKGWREAPRDAGSTPGGWRGGGTEPRGGELERTRRVGQPLGASSRSGTRGEPNRGGPDRQGGGLWRGEVIRGREAQVGGGARGSKGSWPRPAARCRRMRSTTRGSVSTDTIFILTWQVGQSSGSAAGPRRRGSPGAALWGGSWRAAAGWHLARPVVGAGSLGCGWRSTRSNAPDAGWSYPGSVDS